MDELITAVENWAIERDLHKAEPRDQFLKVTEEIGEIAGAIAKGNMAEAKLEIGDGIVTLIILSMQLDLNLKDCLEAAYDKIKDRKGKTINGIYVKQEDLTDRCNECGKDIDTNHDPFTRRDNIITCLICYAR